MEADHIADASGDSNRPAKTDETKMASLNHAARCALKDLPVFGHLRDSEQRFGDRNPLSYPLAKLALANCDGLFRSADALMRPSVGRGPAVSTYAAHRRAFGEPFLVFAMRVELAATAAD